MAFLQNTFNHALTKPKIRNHHVDKMKELNVICCIFDPNNFIGEVSLRKIAREEIEILQRINNSYLMQNIGIYNLEGENDEVFQVIGISLQNDQEIYLPLFSTEVTSLLDFEFSSSNAVSSNKVKTLKKIAFKSCEKLNEMLKRDIVRIELTFSPLPQERVQFVTGQDTISKIQLSDRLSSIIYNSKCQHRDLQRLAYHLKNNNEISVEAYDEYVYNLKDKSGIDKMDIRDDINKFIESSKCQESDFQQILALTTTISWNSISTYFMKRILYEISRDIKNLEIIQRAFLNQYKNLELSDNRDKSLDAQYFDTNSLYILPCYYVPSKNVIQDSSNKKANKISRSEISKEEDITFEMKTRVMKKTTDMKQIVKQLRLYEARYPSNNELNYYIGISVNEEIFFPRKKEDFIKILKDNISDWKIGNKDGRYGVKACGKRFKLNNKTYTNTERHQMPDIFEYSSLVQRKFFHGMKSFDLIISKDDLAVQKVILSRDDGFEAPENYRIISNVVENSKCVDTEFVKLVSSLWNQDSLSQVSLVTYCKNNNLDIEKVEKLSVGTDHRQVIKVSSTVAPDFLLLVQLLARVNTHYLLDYCRYYFTSIPKIFDDRTSVSNFFVSILDTIRKKTR